MQEFGKVELELPTSPKNDVMQDITKVLEKGQESAHQLRRFFSERLGLEAQDHAALSHHSSVTLSSIETVLSILKSCSSDQGEILIIKRKIEAHSSLDHCKSEVIAGGAVTSKERRGCYKRRRTGESLAVEVTNLTDDGHAWRKYGQKGILHTDYPRNYYRCTHKNDQGCQATKQVQQISENPPKYRLIYHGQHTCKNLLKTPSIILDDCPEENSSSILLSFVSNKCQSTAKHALTPSLFPPSGFHTSPATVKQECTSPIKVESPPSSAMPLDHLSGTHNQYSSSSDNCLPSSPDITSIGLPSTPVSEQGDGISSTEFYSSTPNPYEMDEDLLNLITLGNQYAPNNGFWDDILA